MNVLKPYVSLHLNYLLWQCCALGLVRFKHKNHLVRVKKKIMFWLKLSGFAATKTAAQCRFHVTTVPDFATPPLLPPPPPDELMYRTCKPNVIWYTVCNVDALIRFDVYEKYKFNTSVVCRKMPTFYSGAFLLISVFAEIYSFSFLWSCHILPLLWAFYAFIRELTLERLHKMKGELVE